KRASVFSLWSSTSFLFSIRAISTPCGAAFIISSLFTSLQLIFYISYPKLIGDPYRVAAVLFCRNEGWENNGIVAICTATIRLYQTTPDVYPGQFHTNS